MTQPDHSQIMQAIGHLQGEMVGIRNDIKANGKHAAEVNEKVTALAERVSRIELWKAELKGMSIGAKVTWGGVIAFLSAAVSAGGAFVYKKFGGS